MADGEANPVGAWLGGLPPEPRAVEELGRFGKEGDRLSLPYREQPAASVRRLISSRVEAVTSELLANQGQATPAPR